MDVRIIWGLCIAWACVQPAFADIDPPPVDPSDTPMNMSSAPTGTLEQMISKSTQEALKAFNQVSSQSFLDKQDDFLNLDGESHPTHLKVDPAETP